jgi:hypothetical protein
MSYSSSVILCSVQKLFDHTMYVRELAKILGFQVSDLVHLVTSQ